jgi:hypothetical protein
MSFAGIRKPPSSRNVTNIHSKWDRRKVVAGDMLSVTAFFSPKTTLSFNGDGAGGI